MKKWVAVAVLVVATLVAGWFGGPYLTVHGLSQALEQRDTTRLQRYVDFPQVRTSLRAQMNDHMVRMAGPEVANSPFGGLLYGLGNQLSGAAVDTLVTPMGVAAMLQGNTLWKRGRNELEGNSTWGATAPARPLKEARHHFERYDRFVIELDGAPGEPPLRVVLEPQGLRWKVVDLQLGLDRAP